MVSTPKSGSSFKIPKKATGLSRRQRILFREAIASFARKAKRERWHTIGGALGQCTEAADEFLWHLDKYGLTGDIEWYSLGLDAYPDVEWEEVERDQERYPLDAGEECKFHVANRVGKNLIIDWTARQFDQDADFPAICVDDTPKSADLDNHPEACEGATI